MSLWNLLAKPDSPARAPQPPARLCPAPEAQQLEAPSPRAYNLTLALEPKFLWFRNAKVGTRSTLRWLDDAGVHYEARQAFTVHYCQAATREFFKFAFVRNPWDRLVSGWLNKVVTKNALKLPETERRALQSFPNFVAYCASLDLDTCNIHFRRQCRLIDLNNIDYLGRIESLDAGLDEIAARLGLPRRRPPRLNVSKRGGYRDYYDAQTRKRVEELYALDIQLFGYSF